MNMIQENNLKTAIQDYLNNQENVEEVNIPLLPINSFIKIMEELGFEDVDQETNGWQVDFRIYFESPSYDEPYCLSGSLYYGNYKFSKSNY